MPYLNMSSITTLDMLIVVDRSFALRFVAYNTWMTSVPSICAQLALFLSALRLEKVMPLIVVCFNPVETLTSKGALLLGIRRCMRESFQLVVSRE